MGSLTKLSFFDWKYLVTSTLLLPIVDLSLRLFGYRRTLGWLTRWPGSMEKAVIGTGDAESVAIARIVSLAGRRSVWPTSCLRQALVLWVLLARRGIAAEIRVGVEMSSVRGFAAHAWVERNGIVLIGGEHVRDQYVTLL